MNIIPSQKTMYEALLNKDASFEGVFFVGVKTTGIFCRPTCSAKKPLLDNTEFFKDTSEALNAGYRPCKRCNPMQPAGTIPRYISDLLLEVEKEPSRKWKDYELRQCGFEPAKVRRWFLKNHRITFQAYLRARRLGMALGNIKQGDNVTQTAFETGYESLSGFRDAFKKITGTTPGNGKQVKIVYLNRLLTPLGPVLAGADNEGVCLLEFTDRKMLETQLKRVAKFSSVHLSPVQILYLSSWQRNLSNILKES
jgi:AraC family transcriptional regulator, regulatory protein of adaptative response / methylated-DNA-[protein]-cysteine methyltransferase